MGLARELPAHMGNDLTQSAVGRPAGGAALVPEGGHLMMVTTVAGLRALESGWRALEEGHGRPHGVFQTFDWVLSWALSYAGADNAIVVVAGLRYGRLVFAWPLLRQTTGPVAVLRWLSEPLAQYGDIVVERTEDAEAWMDAGLALLRREGGFDSLWLRHVRSDAAAAPYLQKHFQSANLIEQAPWLDLTAFKDDAAYDARYSSSQRKRRKKIRKSLEDDFGPVAFTVLEPGDAATAAMATAVAEKNLWIDERGRQNQILGCPRLLGFLDRLSRIEGGATRMLISCMTAGGKPLSWEIGLRFGKTHFGFITSHVNALTDYSPARLHMDYSQRLALKDGMAAFDLMVPHDAHKESWSSATVDTEDYHLPLTPGGWAYGRLYLEALRPALRAAYYRLPESALRALKPITGH
jgi:CelD/BcsL family acetyltransferase involved in cellulose biosynthesis